LSYKITEIIHKTDKSTRTKGIKPIIVDKCAAIVSPPFPEIYAPIRWADVIEYPRSGVKSNILREDGNCDIP
jgi:hypothetical protein